MKIRRRWMVMLLGLAMGVSLAPAAGWAAIPADALETIRRIPIQHNGRYKPIDSFARETLERLTGAPRIDGQDPVETVLRITADPSRWQETPLISVPFVPLREKLGLDPKAKQISYAQLVEEKKLMRMLPAIVAKQQQDEKLTMLENETMDGYDRFVILTDLFQGKYSLIPPAQGNGAWTTIADAKSYPLERQQEFQRRWETFLTAIREDHPEEIRREAQALALILAEAHRAAYPAPWRINLEIFYNRFGPFRVARILYALVAAGLLWISLKWHKKSIRFERIVFGVLGAAFLTHGAGIAMRVVLGGRPPVSNFYETMLWLPFVGVILALVFERIYRAGTFAFAAAFLASTALLLADHLPLDSSISPVVAVLRSNMWLTIHVLTVVGSYAPLALAAVLAHLYSAIYLAAGPRDPRLAPLALYLYRAVQVGVVMLSTGIMLGAVWANASWGRYWGWDPKETWALITLLWFLAALHGRFAGWLKGIGLALTTIGGFFLLLMTYYGVSFYLVGLHSYAGGNAKPFPPMLVGYVLAEIIFMAMVGFAAVRKESIRV